MPQTPYKILDAAKDEIGLPGDAVSDAATIALTIIEVGRALCAAIGVAEGEITQAIRSRA